MGIEVGLLGLVILVLDVWAIIKTMSSNAGAGIKAIWVVVLLVLPVVGLLLWIFLGPKGP